MAIPWLQIIGCLALISGAAFAIWRIVSAVKNAEQRAAQEKERADINESTVKGMVESKIQESSAEEKANHAKDIAGQNIFDWK